MTVRARALTRRPLPLALVVLLPAVALLAGGSVIVAVAILVTCVINLVAWANHDSLREETREAYRRASESEELFRRSFDDGATGLVVAALDGSVMRANRAFANLVGVEPDELIGRRLDEFTHPDDRGADVAEFHRLVAGDIDVLRHRKRYVTAGGDFVWVELHCSCVRDLEGRPLHMTAQVQDITARKRAEEGLRASETRYAALVQHLPETIVAIYDRDLRCTFLGGALIEGEEDRYLGKTLADVLPERRAREWAARFRAAFAGIENEFHWTSQDGKEWEVRVLPLPDADGQVTTVMSVTRDVTERRAKDEELRESRERLQAILDYAPAVIYLKDAEGRFVLGNHGLEDLMRVSFDQIRGRTDDDLFPSATAEVLREQDRQVRESGRPLAREFEVEVDGEVRTYFDIKFPIFNARGETTGVCAIATDITARKNAEVALRISEQRHRSVVEALDEGVLLYDSRGVVIAANQKAADMVHMEPWEMIGKASHELPLRLVDENGEEFAREERPGYQAILTGEPQLGIIAGHPRRDGEMIWLSINAIPLADESVEGAPYAVATSFADITERRRAERLKEEFFALVSHELRTPLTSIAGYLELLMDEDADTPLTPEQSHFLGVVERNAKRLQRLVGDLLFVAQFEAGKLSLDMAPVRIRDVAAEAVESAGPRAAELGLDLRLNAEDVPELTGDAGRLGQTVDNLISNALKFTPAGGRVDVRVLDRHDHAVIEVADTGLGISQTEQERLFERFFRTEVATEMAIPGVGLGLSISKAIVEGHGGAIAVRSDEGRGTTFMIELPLTGGRTRRACQDESSDGQPQRTKSGLGTPSSDA